MFVVKIFDSKLIKSLCLALLSVCVFVGPVESRAQQDSRTGTALLVDVSGSMRFDGEWKRDVQRTLERLVAGGVLDEETWRVDGEADDAFVRRVRNGNPIHISGQPLIMMEIGEIDAEYPFVDYQVVRPSDPNSTADFIREKFPKSFDEDWTYYGVSNAVVRDVMLEQGALQWYVISVSDEDDDYNDSGNVPEKAKELDNGYGTRVREEKLLALSYKKDTDLRMSVKRVISRSDPCSKNADLPLCDGPSPEDASIALRLPDNQAEVTEQPTFRWVATPNFNGFEIVVSNADGEMVIRERTDAKTFTPEEELVNGSYQWRVTGRGNGTRLSSETRAVVVRGETGGSAFLTVLGWLVALGVFGGGGFLGWQYFSDQADESRGSSPETFNLDA